MKPLCLLLILATAVAAKPKEFTIATLFGCIAATEETVKAICLYQMQHGSYPKNLAVLQNRHIHCPVSGKEYVYKVSANGKDFLLFCRGKVYRCDGSRPDHPRFSSRGFKAR